MRRTMMKSKIHRATVTLAELQYEGSLSIDEDLLDAADILPAEQIHVWDVTNGTRLITYAIAATRGSGVVQVNGAGAHLIQPGDIVIVATFTTFKTRAARKHQPLVIFVDGENKIKPALTPDVDPSEPTELMDPQPEKPAKAPRTKKKGKS